MHDRPAADLGVGTAGAAVARFGAYRRMSVICRGSDGSIWERARESGTPGLREPLGLERLVADAVACTVHHDLAHDMAHDIFISHSKKDKHVASAVVHALEEADVRCWISYRNIEEGADWDESIVNAIKTGTKAMVLIFSGNSNRSKWVKREILLAVSREITVVPFRIEDIEPEAGLELHLAATHWLDAIAPPMAQHLQKLVERIRGLVSEATPRSEPDAPPNSRAEPKLRPAGTAPRPVRRPFLELREGERTGIAALRVAGVFAAVWAAFAVCVVFVVLSARGLADRSRSWNQILWITSAPSLAVFGWWMGSNRWYRYKWARGSIGGRLLVLAPLAAAAVVGALVFDTDLVRRSHSYSQGKDILKTVVILGSLSLPGFVVWALGPRMKGTVISLVIAWPLAALIASGAGSLVRSALGWKGAFGIGAMVGCAVAGAVGTFVTSLFVLHPDEP